MAVDDHANSPSIIRVVVHQLSWTEISQRLFQFLVCWITRNALFEGLANRFTLAKHPVDFRQHHPCLG